MKTRTTAIATVMLAVALAIAAPVTMFVAPGPMELVQAHVRRRRRCLA